MKTVLISAGHSNVPPIDPGAVANGQKEATLTLRLRDAVASKLKALSVPILTDGSPLQNLPLKEALTLMRKADIRVEIHFNAASDQKATGVESLSKGNLSGLASDLALAVSAATGIRTRGALGWKPSNSGQHSRLAFCEAGGVILEVCFLTNPQDVQKYLANENQTAERLAKVLHEASARE